MADTGGTGAESWTNVPGLISSILPPLTALVYPDDAGPFDSTTEWARIAGDLEQQEKQAEQEEDESSAASDVRLFRVSLTPRPYVEEPRDDDVEPIQWLFAVSPGKVVAQDRSFVEVPAGTPLDLQMADEIHSLYCLYGIAEVIRFGDGISQAYPINRKAFDDAYADGDWADEEKFSSAIDVYTAFKLVQSVFGRQFGALRNRIEEYQKKVAEAAATVAAARLEEAGREILAETTRYIALEGKSPVSAQKLLVTGTDPQRVQMRGPDYPLLMDAVARLRSRLAALDNPPATPPALFGRLNPLATTAAEDAAHALELELAQACQRFPILNRAWKTLTVTQNVTVPYPFANPTPADLAGHLASIATPATKMSIFGVLRTTWAANQQLRMRIAKEPDVVWLFPSLIHETLEKMAEDDPDFSDLGAGSRAAEELLEERAERLTEKLAMIVGFLDLAAAFTSPAPPVALCVAGVSLIFSLADSLVEYQQLRDQDDAANSVLDPRKALSADPSYLFFAIGVAMSILELRGMRNAYKAARVTREVDELASVVQAAI